MLMTAGNDAMRGEIPTRLSAALTYLCRTTVSTTLVCLLPYLNAWHLLIRSLMEFKATMELSTWQTRENINFSDAAARLGPEVDDAMLQDHPKSGTAIDPFPAEIWHIICGNLNRDDLIALRSTSCAIADIAAEYLINTIHLDTSFEAFARLEEITGHPLLRKGVTKLVFEAGLLGNVGCVHNYSR